MDTVPLSGSLLPTESEAVSGSSALQQCHIESFPTYLIPQQDLYGRETSCLCGLAYSCKLHPLLQQFHLVCKATKEPAALDSE